MLWCSADERQVGSQQHNDWRRYQTKCSVDTCDRSTSWRVFAHEADAVTFDRYDTTAHDDGHVVGDSFDRAVQQGLPCQVEGGLVAAHAGAGTPAEHDRRPLA